MTTKRVKLVLSGSGTKFPVFIGAIKRLMEEGYEFKEVCGTSGGAIVAAALASGYNIKELEQLCIELIPNIYKYVDLSLLTFLWKWGLIKGAKIEEQLGHYLPGDLSDTKIPAKVIAVNYDKASIYEPYHIFDTFLTPDVSLSKAVRASMSLPLIFEPVKIGDYRYIDGGITANFPVDIYGDSTDVVGLYMNPGPRNRNKNHKKGFPGLVQYILSIVDIFIHGTTQEYIQDAINAKVFGLKSKHKSLNFSLTTEDVNDMINEGYSQIDRSL